MLFPPLELTALIFVLSWFLTVLASQFGLLTVHFSRILFHGVYLQLIWNWGSLVDNAFPCLPGGVPEELFGNSLWTRVTRREIEAVKKCCEDWLSETPISGRWSIWKQSTFVSWFPLFESQDISRTGLRWTWACWFRRTSFNLDRAPKMRLSVQLNSWDVFLLYPHFSETWVRYRAWMFLGSCMDNPVIAANFFSNNCHLQKRKKLSTALKTESLIFLKKNGEKWDSHVFGSTVTG